MPASDSTTPKIVPFQEGRAPERQQTALYHRQNWAFPGYLSVRSPCYSFACQHEGNEDFKFQLTPIDAHNYHRVPRAIDALP